MNTGRITRLVFAVVACGLALSFFVAGDLTLGYVLLAIAILLILSSAHFR